MENRIHLYGRLKERAGYFSVSGAHLYTVPHQIQDPAAVDSEEAAAERYKKPFEIETLACDAAPLTKGELVGYDDLKEFNWLLAPDSACIVSIGSQLSREIAHA